MKFLKSIKDIFNKGKQEVKAILSPREAILLKHRDKIVTIDNISFMLRSSESRGDRVYEWTFSVKNLDDDAKFVDMIRMNDDEILNIPSYVDSVINLKKEAIILSKTVDDVIDESFIIHIQDEFGSDVELGKWYGYLKYNGRNVSPVLRTNYEPTIACKVCFNKSGVNITNSILDMLTELVEHKLSFHNNIDIKVNDEDSISSVNQGKYIRHHANIMITKKN